MQIKDIFRSYETEKNDVLNKRDFSEVVCEPPGYILTIADLRPLCLSRRSSVRSRYLTDNTINSYLSIVLNTERVNFSPHDYVFNANFTNYFENLDENNVNEFSLEFLTQNGIGKSNFLGSKRYYFPVHVSPRHDHWVLICLNRETKCITQFDSLNNPFYTDIYVNFLKFLNVKIPGPQFEATKYTFDVSRSAAQMDSTSCGIYTILNLLTELNIIDFSIDSNDFFIDTVKMIMVHELLAFKNDPECFIMDILGQIDSQ